MRTLFALGVIAAVLVASGCGSSGSGGESTAEGKALTAAQFGKQAEAICRKTSARQAQNVQKLAAEYPPGSLSQEKLAKISAKAAKPIYLTMAEELESLSPPAGAEGDKYREWVEAVKEAVNKMEAPGSEGIDATVNAHTKAKELGMEPCALV